MVLQIHVVLEDISPISCSSNACGSSRHKSNKLFFKYMWFFKTNASSDKLFFNHRWFCKALASQGGTGCQLNARWTISTLKRYSVSFTLKNSFLRYCLTLCIIRRGMKLLWRFRIKTSANGGSRFKFCIMLTEKIGNNENIVE